jgi:arsenite methyltransferase|mmetsp:Transcript_9229/g.30707  ORF Transcript_9229/g.30707 Transcript_9229/m.30707 type:complete len:157 (-) Transcript_9229:285-755(-)
MLVSTGFCDVRVVEKQESREFIKDWLPGSGAEDFVVSANVTAVKPMTIQSVENVATNKWADLVSAETKKTSSACVPPPSEKNVFADAAAEAFAAAAGIETSAGTIGVGKAVADLTTALGQVIRSLGEHHARHTGDVRDAVAEEPTPEPVVETKAGC